MDWVFLIFFIDIIIAVPTLEMETLSKIEDKSEPLQSKQENKFLEH